MDTRDSILGALTRAVTSRTEWDEEPALYFLYADAFGARLSQAAVPYGAWSRGRPPEVLEEMSYVLQAGAAEDGSTLAILRPESLYGMAFRSEAYFAVANERTDPGSGERLVADARARRISQRPDRVEIRFIQAVDRDGTFYYVHQRRDSGEIASDVSPGGGDGPQVGGTVPEALMRMAAALLGSIPGRGQ